MSTAAEVYMCISGEGEGGDEDDGDDKYDYDYGGMELVMDDEKAKVWSRWMLIIYHPAGFSGLVCRQTSS